MFTPSITKDKKSFCFISETRQNDRPINDPSVRYRCYNPAEVLTEMGHFCVVYSASNFYENVNFDFDVYVFHRPNCERKNFYSVFKFLKAAGKTLIADYDDLIFGDALIAIQSSAARNGTLTEEQAISTFSINLASLLQFDLVTTSTTTLSEYVKKFNPTANVLTIHNIIPPSITQLHQELGTAHTIRPKTSIGYFAGTKSHDKDFPIVEEALYRVLCENEDYSLTVIGPVKIPLSIAKLSNVTYGPPVSYPQLPFLMTKCSTVIAPLENSEFNNCKSRVKFLEASLSGCRLIASPIPDMVAIGSEYITFATTKSEWYEALSQTNGNPKETICKNSNFLTENALNINQLNTFGESK